MKISRILVEIHHGLGDVIQMIPLFEKLRELYPDAEIDAIVASEAHADLLKTVNIVNEFHYINLRKDKLIELFSTCWRLRKKRFSVGFVAPISTQAKGRALMHIVGCKKIISYDDVVPVYKKNAVLRNLELLKQMGIDVEVQLPRISLESIEAYRESIKEKIKKEYNIEVNKNALIGLCIRDEAALRGEAYDIRLETAKAIPAGEILNLAARLIHDGYNIVLLGGKTDKSALEEGAGHLDGRIINLVGQLSVMETLAMMSFCQVIVGGDFGLTHMADAIQIPTLVYYGTTGPDVVGPFSNITRGVTAGLSCQYCYKEERQAHCQDHKCIRYVTCDILYDEIRKVL